VVDSLEAALWAFAGSDSFEEGALKAVNLGDDADTTGAVFGQIGGAFYGVEGIPEGWLAKVAMRERIEELAEGLHFRITEDLDPRGSAGAECQRRLGSRCEAIDRLGR
jgi:ADP-ribosyl-[dinitrogen reductase] hydrolase